MKYRFILVYLIVLSGCDDPGIPVQAVSDDTVKIVIPEKSSSSGIQLSWIDLKEKVFKAGDQLHFTDSCVFYFECDCCAGDIIFNPDSTFYYIQYCMDDESVACGKYSIDEKSVLLDFNGLIISRNYNWENESDSTAVDFFMNDTLSEAVRVSYLSESCGNKIRLKEKNNKEIAISTNADYLVAINQLEKDGFLMRIRNFKRNE